MAKREGAKKLVVELNEVDVLMGRGKGTNNRPGNVNFRDLASERVHEYEMSGSGGRKTEIARQLIQQIEAKGGRFLRSVTASNAKGEVTAAWEVVDEDAKLTKVKQAIRDAASTRRKKEEGKDNETQQDRQRWSPHPGDQGPPTVQTSVPSWPQPHFPPSSSAAAAQYQQHRHNQPSYPYNMYFPPAPSMPPAHSGIDALLAQREQERLLLQQEFARYQQQQQGLAQYQQHLRTLQMANPSSGLSLLDPAARPFFHLLQSSLPPGDRRTAQQQGRESALRQQDVDTAARKRAREGTGIHPPESDSDEPSDQRKPSAKVQRHSQQQSDVPRVLPSVAIQPFASSSVDSLTSIAASTGNNVPLAAGGQNTHLLRPHVERKRSSSSPAGGSKASASSCSSVSTKKTTSKKPEEANRK